MIHKTRGIVLRTIQYGETSVITTIFTELLGIQSYIVKGVRQTSKKGASKSGYFQPATIVELEVYHNSLKQLQFIKEYRIGFLYSTIFFDVIRNSIGMFIVEMVLNCLKEPESNPDLYYLIETYLIFLDQCLDSEAANLPLHFTLSFLGALGFQLQGSFTDSTPYLDLQEGSFTDRLPNHVHFFTHDLSKITSEIIQSDKSTLSKIPLSRNQRRELIEGYQKYIQLHILEFRELKSIKVLQELLA